MSERHKSHVGVYTIAALATGLVAYLLMRGRYYNWLDSEAFIQLTLVATALGLSLIYTSVKRRCLNTASSQLQLIR
ncbi:hypothetical protein P4S64_06455 [Vibrio sp. M60_M31a]